jgi:REP element-mobilizing transposase RayT
MFISRGEQVHASCLMRNHFHFVVETPEPNLSAGMKWVLQTYSSRFNRRHRFFGHVVRRALQSAAGRWQWHGLFAERGRVRSFEPGARPAAPG